MYQPRHAQPSCLNSRTALTTGLTAALLPLTMATPALAQTATSDTSTVGISQPTPSAEPAPAPAAKQQTVLRISGPRGVRAPGAQPVYVRLLADGAPVKNGYVRLERKTATGWVYAGRLLTRADGLGGGTLSMTASTRLRAVYQGSATRTAAASAELVVNVAKPAAALGQRVLAEAARHNGKPYRYGATGPSSFDCSGFIGYVYRSVGKSLPRTSQQQANATRRVSQAAKQPGDLLFFGSGGRVSHVGIYAGGNKMWAAPTTGRNVNLQSIYTSRYFVGRVA